MSTTNLKTLTRCVNNALIEMYGEQNVERNPPIPETTNRPDFQVFGPLCRFYVVCAPDFESAIHAAGYGIHFATLDRHAVPIIAVPEGTLTEPAADAFATRGPVKLVEVRIDDDDEEGGLIA